MSEKETVAGPTISKKEFGTTPEGAKVHEFTLTNSRGMIVKILTYGALIRECWVPDRHGKVANVVLGFDNLKQYIAKHPRFGSTIGRYANRISNAEFELDGVTYKLAANKGTTCIHGGNVGFDKRVWEIAGSGQSESNAWVRLRYLSADMEEGFPGQLDTNLTFSLDENNSLFLHYQATTDKATPINLTNHSYFNLAGAGEGNILDHVASFNSNYYTPLNADLVPAGPLAPVEHTPFDFRRLTRIGDRIKEAGGYDLNYVINGRAGVVENAGAVTDPASGRVMSVYTDQPAFQFFTANGLDGSIVGNGGKYNAYAGFCIETQHYPDSVNRNKYPNTILRPHEEFQSVTQYAFSNMPEGWAV